MIGLPMPQNVTQPDPQPEEMPTTHWSLIARLKGVDTEQARMALDELCRMVRDTSLCALGSSAPNPVLTSLRHFRDEFEFHVKYPTKVKDPNHFAKEPFRKEVKMYA